MKQTLKFATPNHPNSALRTKNKPQGIDSYKTLNTITSFLYRNIIFKARLKISTQPKPKIISHNTSNTMWMWFRRCKLFIVLADIYTDVLQRTALWTPLYAGRCLDNLEESEVYGLVFNGHGLHQHKHANHTSKAGGQRDFSKGTLHSLTRGELLTHVIAIPF